MKNTLSIFPEGIDSRIFFSDIDIDHISLMKQHQQLLSQNRFSESSALLDNSDISYYGAWLPNLFDDRIYNIERYIITKEKPKLTIYQTDEPASDLTANISWIGD